MSTWHTVTVTHISLKHVSPQDGPDPKAVGAYVAHVVNDAGSDIFTTTESGKEYLEEIRAWLPEDWSVALRREYVIGFKKSVFKRRPLRRLIVRRMTRTLGMADWRNVFVLHAYLRHIKSRRRWTHMVGHLPASVQNGPTWRWENHLAVLTHSVGTSKWGGQCKRRARYFPNTVQLAAYDSNLDHKLLVWRSHMAGDFGMNSLWNGSTAVKGTHPHTNPSRLIDAGNTNARVLSSWVSPVSPPRYVDHWAFSARLGFWSR